VKRLLVLCALLAVPAASQAARLGGTPVALVTAETENRLIAVDLPSGRTIRTLGMPAGPQNVVTNARFAVVVSPSAGTVTLVGLPRLRVLEILRGFASPHLAAFVPQHEIAYVTDDASGRLAVIDLARRRVTREVFVGLGAHHMAISPDWTRLWVALGERARSIAVLDTTHPGVPRLIGRIDPGGEAHDLAFGPKGVRVWVTYDDRSRIALFDAASGRRVQTIAAGSPPQHVAFGPDGRHAYVTSGDDGTLRIVSLRNLRTVRRISVAPGSFNVATGGSLVLTSSLTDGMLTELDENGRLLLRKRVAPAARDVAVAIL
jgi:DNA-binding beta-propeller fold protein YncE